MNENQHKFHDVVHLFFISLRQFFQSNTPIQNLLHTILHGMLNLLTISIFLAEKSIDCVLIKFHVVFYSL